ncbi:MAG: phosphonate ABC transporter, permease protein PhnE [Anaerolineales bacterium]
MNAQIQQEPQEKQKPSLVPPFLTAIFSLLIPGLGQILARAYRRGVILIVSFISLMGLMIWRIQLAGRRGEGALAIIQKAYHLRPILIVLTVLIGILYLWIAYDAYLIAKKTEGSPLGLIFMVLIIFFIMGWQIGEINPIALVTDLDEAASPLGKVLWPWERAISYPAEEITAKAPIQVPCTDNPPGDPEYVEGEPYLRADPTCGQLSEQAGPTGTELTLYGENFAPGKTVDILWEDPIGNEFRQRQEGEYVTVLPDENGEFSLEIVMPYRVLPPSATKEFYIWTVKAQQVVSLGAAKASQELKLAVEKIIETIFIGMMATFFGVIIAIPVSFLAARNLMSATPLTLIIYYVVRGIMNIVRSIEPLIWAVIALIVVGLGPFAGIIALTVHSVAALAKLYSESIESIDPGPIEAVQATGANWAQTIMYGVVPQIVPPFVSFTIYRWDINIRMSTVIGMVGGGGIGFLLIQWMRLLDYRAAGIAIWFITITVAILDYVSAEIRERFV